MQIDLEKNMQLRISGSTSTTLKWANASPFLINFWVPDRDLCVHCAFPETSERSTKSGSWPGFHRHHSKISILKGKKQSGRFLKSFCSWFYRRIYTTIKTVWNNVSVFWVFFIAFAPQANDGGGSGYSHNSVL